MFEEIEETNNGWRSENVCEHRLITRSETITPFTYSTSTTNSFVQYCTWTSDNPSRRWLQHNGGTPYRYGAWGDCSKGELSASNYYFRDLHARAYDSMWPGIRSEVSILNALYELKDFKRLLPFLNRLSTSIPSIIVRFKRKWSSASSRATLRELLRLTSEGYLTSEFAIRPLLSDLTGLFKAMESARRQLKKLIDDEGKVRRRYFVANVPDFFETFDVNETVALAQTYSGTKIRCIHSEGADGPPVFRSRLEYSFSLPGHVRAHAELLALLDVLGVNLNPQIIWNALPWSFVVDWVIGVNRWLSNFKTPNVAPVVYVRKFCWSIKATRDVQCKVHWSVGGPAGSGELTCRSTTERYYFRTYDRPDWSHQAKLSGLNLKEFSFIGALAGVRA